MDQTTNGREVRKQRRLCGVIYLKEEWGKRYCVMKNERNFLQRCEIPACSYAGRNELVRRRI